MTSPSAPSLPDLGLAFVPWNRTPEQLPDFARLVEDGGLDDLWLWEDCFAEGGLAAAAVALASTTRIRVVVGLLPAPLRNVALTAMEIATLARIYPGRLIPGIGHGVQDWMAQAGAKVASPMTLLREYTVALRALLSGEEVTCAGRYVTLDRVKLAYPPAVVPPLYLGGFGEKTLALSVELGDGVMLARGGVDAGMALRDHAAAAERAVDVCVELGPDEGADAAGVGEVLRRAAAAGIAKVQVVPAADEPDLAGLVRAMRDA